MNPAFSKTWRIFPFRIQTTVLLKYKLINALETLETP